MLYWAQQLQVTTLVFIDFFSVRLPSKLTTFLLGDMTSLDNSLDSSFGQRGKPLDISAPNSIKETYERLVKKQKFSLLPPFNISISPNSLTFIPSMEDVPCADQNKDKASQVRRLRVNQWRLIIEKDDNNNYLVIQVKSNGKSWESVGKVDSNVSSGSNGDVGLTKDDPFVVKIPRGITSSKRMDALVLRSGVPPDYVCRILGDEKYISSPSPLEVAICEETFQAEFCFSLYPFIQRLLVKYRLIPTQIPPSA